MTPSTGSTCRLSPKIYGIAHDVHKFNLNILANDPKHCHDQKHIKRMLTIIYGLTLSLTFVYINCTLCSTMFLL